MIVTRTFVHNVERMVISMKAILNKIEKEDKELLYVLLIIATLVLHYLVEDLKILEEKKDESNN